MLGMKRLLIAAGLGLLLLVGAFVAYAAWFVRRVAVDPAEVRASLRPSQGGMIEIEVATTGTSGEVVITEIEIERPLRDALGLSPPAGFQAEPLHVEEAEREDKEAVAFVAKYNLGKVRYTGKLTVTPDIPAVLRFPAEHPIGATGQIRLQHERKVGMGGSIGFLSVPVGTP
jgi:hypothetical protein